jgi:pantoate kinase
VLLLNDSIGATLMRVRDRIIGVSLGVLDAPGGVQQLWPLPRGRGPGDGGTAALITALRLDP